MVVILPHGGVQRIDNRIAGYKNVAVRLTFLQQVLTAHLRRGKVEPADQIHGLTVKLLREGRIQVVGAQPRLHMAHGNLHIKAGQGGDKGGGRIPMHQRHIRLFRFQNGFQLFQNGNGYIKQGLLFLHNAQVVIRLYMETIQNLIQHLPVLPCYAHNRLKFGMPLQLQHQGTHLDCLRPCAENQHHLFHLHTSICRHAACIVLAPPVQQALHLGNGLLPGHGG